MSTPVGLCECGCGRSTPIARWNNRAKGYRKGQPMRFVHGHNTSVRPKLGLQYVVTSEGCWLWQLGKQNGYGIMRHNGSKVYVHRLLYQERYGPVPDGLELDHLCRTKACVNPDHLEPVTHQQNIKRHHLAKPCCPHGHPYDEANTYVHPTTGHRICRTCRRDRMRQRYREKRPD